MSEPTLSSHVLRQFVQALYSELGPESLSNLLEKAGASPDWADSTCVEALSGTTAAETFAGLQKAMRRYFGRGARGFLIRVGRNLWKRLLDDASLPLKAQSKILPGLPLDTRRKSALKMLASLLGNQRGDVTVHTLDLDLLLVDGPSPGTLGQDGAGRICYVTLGLLRECLFWATGQEHDIEETSCRANGEEACEFKIVVGR